jgi:hypothetical protein
MTISPSTRRIERTAEIQALVLAALRLGLRVEPGEREGLQGLVEDKGQDERAIPQA